LSKEKKSNKKVVVIITVIIVLAIGAAVMGILTMKGFFAPEPEPRGEGVVGVIVNDWETGLTDVDSSSKPESGTQIPGYTSAQMNEGDTSLKISIGNPKENKVGFYAVLKLDDGTELFRSQLLEPGQGMEEVPLSQTLKKGTYDAMVLYQCVLLNDDHTPLNAAESSFKLIVN